MAFALGARLPGRDDHRRTPRRGRRSPPSERAAALEAAVASATRTTPRPSSRWPGSGSGAGPRRRARARSGPRPALDPTNAEPFAYSGWIIRLQGFPDQALQLLDKAVAVDPPIPTPTSSAASSCSGTRRSPSAAIPDFQQYLVAAPDSPLADQVRTLLAEAVEAGK